MKIFRRTLALLGVAFLVVVPLTGCNGSSSQNVPASAPIERAVPTTPQQEEQRAKESNGMSEEELAAVAKAEGH